MPKWLTTIEGISILRISLILTINMTTLWGSTQCFYLLCQNVRESHEAGENSVPSNAPLCAACTLPLRCHMIPHILDHEPKEGTSQQAIPSWKLTRDEKKGVHKASLTTSFWNTPVKNCFLEDASVSLDITWDFNQKQRHKEVMVQIPYS